MRKSIRAALLACAAIATLAFAGTALAAYTSPKLVVGSLTPQAAGSGGPVRVGVTVDNADGGRGFARASWTGSIDDVFLEAGHRARSSKYCGL